MRNFSCIVIVLSMLKRVFRLLWRISLLRSVRARDCSRSERRSRFHSRRRLQTGGLRRDRRAISRSSRRPATAYGWSNSARARRAADVHRLHLGAGKSEATRPLPRDQPRGWRSGEPARTRPAPSPKKGKAIVWIDSGLHASEVAPAQHSPELAYRMVTGESPESRAIRQNVILLQIPGDQSGRPRHGSRTGIGKRGHTLRAAPLPWLYQKYAGHDNNRDWFMLNLPETRERDAVAVSEWFPQIVYNQHQAPPFPARIFVPPYAEPLNPQHSGSGDGRHQHASACAMKERFARGEQAGHSFLLRLRRVVERRPAIRAGIPQHARHSDGDGRQQLRDAEALQGHGVPGAFSNGMPTREPSVFYERPWMGGRWTVRNAIDYMLTADFAILTQAAARRADFLLKSYQMARQSMAAGAAGHPYAYILAARQWDLAGGLGVSRTLVACRYRSKERARGISRQWQRVSKGHAGHCGCTAVSSVFNGSAGTAAISGNEGKARTTSRAGRFPCRWV